jgi:hypothetical protein
MPKGSTKVRVILAPDFGERLRSLPLDGPVWVADTPVNGPIIRQTWRDKFPGITSFHVDEKTGPDEWLVSILDAIELHHGECSQSPPYAKLCVSGTALSAKLQAKLEGYGFNAFEVTPDGFIANKVEA